MMRKLVKYSLVLMAISAFLIFPNKVYAAPSSEADTTEEDTAGEETAGEETAGEGTAGDAESKGEWINEQGYDYYRKNGMNYTGWNKIKGKWYFFDGAGRLRYSNVGIYEIDKKNGNLLNCPKSDKFVPEPHGYIINSSEVLVLNDGHEGSDSVIAEIDALYNSQRKVSESKIRAARSAYNALPMSEKVRVTNESELAELEVTNGISYDYEVASGTDAMEEDNDSAKGQKFNFSIEEGESDVTVKIFFESDVDNDGVPDVPDIRLLPPVESKELIELTKGASQTISNQYVELVSSWDSNYLQIDMVGAIEGEWVITSSNICEFSVGPYSGALREFDPISDGNTNHSETDSEGNQSDEEDSTVVTLILLVVVIAIFVGLMVGIKKVPMGKDKKEKDEKANTSKKALSKEEEYELLKKELDNMSDEYKDDEVATAEYYNNDFSQPEKMEFSQQEIKESLEAYDSTVSVNDPEADTDVLISNQNFVGTASEYMNEQMGSNASVNNSEKGDGWYEEEE